MHLYADPGVVAIACPLYLPAPDAFPERRGTAIRHSLEIWRMAYSQRPRSCPNCLVFRHPVRADRGPTGPTEVIMKPVIVKPASILLRSEERSVGKEGVSTCRSGGSPYH